MGALLARIDDSVLSIGEKKPRVALEGVRTVAGLAAWQETLFVLRGYDSSNDDELTIYSQNVDDPMKPAKLGSLALGIRGLHLFGFMRCGSQLCVATRDRGKTTIRTIDLPSATPARLSGQIVFGGSAVMASPAQDGPFLCVGVLRQGNLAYEGLCVIDLTRPETAKVVGEVRVSGFAGEPDSVSAVGALVAMITKPIGFTWRSLPRSSGLHLVDVSFAGAAARRRESRPADAAVCRDARQIRLSWHWLIRRERQRPADCGRQRSATPVEDRVLPACRRYRRAQRISKWRHCSGSDTARPDLRRGCARQRRAPAAGHDRRPVWRVGHGLCRRFRLCESRMAACLRALGGRWREAAAGRCPSEREHDRLHEAARTTISGQTCRRRSRSVRRGRHGDASLTRGKQRGSAGSDAALGGDRHPLWRRGAVPADEARARALRSDRYRASNVEFAHARGAISGRVGCSAGSALAPDCDAEPFAARLFLRGSGAARESAVSAVDSPRRFGTVACE